MPMRRGLDLSLCTLSAVLIFMGFPTALAPENSFWPTLWVSHVPLLFLLRDKAPAQAFRWGLLCGVLTNAGGYYWLAEMLERFGHLPSPVAYLGLALHSLHVGLMWGFWAFLINRVTNTTRVPLEWIAPAAMVAIELAWPRIFPAYMGNSQYLFAPVMQVVDLVGIYGVTFLLYHVNAVLFLWLRARIEGRKTPVRALGVAAFLVTLALGYGLVRIDQVDALVAAATKLRVGLVEGDVGIFESEPLDKRRDHLRIQQRLTADLESRGAELVLWSESAYRMSYDGEPGLPQSITRLPPAQTPLVSTHREDQFQRTPQADIYAPIRGFKVPTLIGATSARPREVPRYEGDTPDAYFNSAFLLDGDGQVHGRYDKNYLLIGGEYIPLSEYFPWIFKLIPSAGDLTPGKSLKTIDADLWGKGLVRLGVLICYEGILPAFARGLSSERPHFLVNMTNDDWFGDTAERHLHFALAVPRAIEHRLAFARVTLTGVSAFVDPVGRIVSQTPVTGEDTLMWDVPLLQSQTVYQRFGDAFALLCLGLTLAAYFWGRVRRA